MIELNFLIATRFKRGEDKKNLNAMHKLRFMNYDLRMLRGRKILVWSSRPDTCVNEYHPELILSPEVNSLPFVIRTS